MYLLGGSLAWVDFTGQTPFLLAAFSGDVTTMRLLLDHKADPKLATDGGTNALMAAAGVNWVVNQTFTEGEPALLEAVKLCWELGLDVNATNSMGLTAAMGAANRGSDSIIEFLASKGARLDVKDSVGRTAFNWAEGVFLATHAPVPKPGTMALIQKLLGQSQTASAAGK
jgi:ankyrin repeat protein